MTSARSRRSSLLGSCCHRRRDHQLSPSSGCRRRRHHHRMSAAAGSPVNRRLPAVAVVCRQRCSSSAGGRRHRWHTSLLTGRDTYRSAIAEARRESAAITYRSQCCMITESRRRHAVEKAPYRRALESARRRAVGWAHRWQAARSARRCGAGYFRHRLADASTERRSAAVAHRAVPGRSGPDLHAGRRGSGVLRHRRSAAVRRCAAVREIANIRVPHTLFRQTQFEVNLAIARYVSRLRCVRLIERVLHHYLLPGSGGKIYTYARRTIGFSTTFFSDQFSLSPLAHRHLTAG